MTRSLRHFFALPLLFLAALVLFLPQSAIAQFDLPGGGGGDRVQARLISENETIAPGKPFTVALELTHKEDVYTYWINPGTGRPTKIEWSLPEGFSAGPIIWPLPKAKSLDGVMGHGYTGSALLLIEIVPPENLEPGTEVSLRGQARWLACDQSGCVPGGSPVALQLSVAGEAKLNDEVATRFEKVRAGQAVYLDVWEVTSSNAPDSFEVKLAAGEGANGDPGKIYYFEPDGILEAGFPEQNKEGDTITLTLKKNEDEAAEEPSGGFFYAPNGWLADGSVKALAFPGSLLKSPPVTTDKKVETSSSSTDTEANESSTSEDEMIKEIRSWGLVTLDGAETEKLALPLILLFGFLGGMILNLMPCVFPVLGIKILGFVQQAGEDHSVVRKHGLAYGVGVIFSLWALVGVLLIIKFAGQTVGWGFQLQNPVFLAFLILFLFIFGLNLSGLFEFGTSLTGAGDTLQSKSGYAGSFFSGTLTVLVATPCTGPFLAPAFAYALSAPVAETFAVFTAMAIGLALPYVMLSYFPALVNKLPRPGAWMETFKQFMAFPLYATVIWLVSTLGATTGRSGVTWMLGTLLLTTMAVWLYGRSSGHSKKPVGLTIAGLFAVGALGLTYYATNLRKPASSGPIVRHGMQWVPFSLEDLIEHRKKGRTVFIDFTADW